MKKFPGTLFVVFLFLYISCDDTLKSPEYEGHGIFHIHESIEPYTWNPDSVESAFRILVNRIESESNNSRKMALVDSFVRKNRGDFPLIENDILVHFIFYDSLRQGVQVRISGDFTEWNMSPLEFSRVPYTKLYYYSRIFEPDARIEYKLMINDIWEPDPFNPHTFSPDDYETNSELAMPLYEPPAEIESYDIPHGTVKSLLYYPPDAPRERTVWIYLPPQYDENQQYPVNYFHDGRTYVTTIQTPNILDYLIDKKQMRPIIGVFVEYLSRDDEYVYNEEFVGMFADELVPWIDARYSTDREPESRAITGFSHGGTAALLTALNHPDVFGKCAAFSPAINIGDMVDQYRHHKVFRTEFYLDAGTYEYWLYEPTSQLAGILSEKGFNGHFYTWHEYHSVGSWRAHLDNALTYFWPAE